MPGRRIVVWYNTRCPVCNGGIDWQRNKLNEYADGGLPIPPPGSSDYQRMATTG
jgi:hypothetical protein